MKFILVILGLCTSQILAQDDGVLRNYSNLTRAASSLPSRCGISSRGRIIGGNVALPHKYPWVAFLLTRRVVNGQNRWSYCGATVISDRWLVTAAHCLEGAAQLVVRAGCHNYNRCARIEIASRWIIHPSYNRATINNDIGLVQLRRPLRFGFRIQPACLPGASLPVNTRVIVAGWGRTSNNGQGSSSLKEGIMLTQSRLTCTRYLGSGFDYSTTVCANRINANICFGDSGTSMGRFLNGRFQLDGVNSFVSSRGCDQAPNGFVRVKTFVPWIQANV